MCGRYSIYDIEELNSKYGNLDFKPAYNAAPKMKLPVVTDDGVKILQWGFELGNFFMINTRAESVSTKFKWMLESRCLVPVNGFFEWKKNGNKKIPYNFGMKNHKLFFLAGVVHEDKFSIITTSANKEMVAIHDRMPVILNSDGERKWLTDGDVKLLHPYTKKMEMYQVSEEVNNVRNNNEKIIKKLATLDSF